MNGHSLESFQMFGLLKLSKISDKVTVQINGFKVREICEIIVQLDEIVMREVYPLQLLWILHDAV